MATRREHGNVNKSKDRKRTIPKEEEEQRRMTWWVRRWQKRRTLRRMTHWWEPPLSPLHTPQCVDCLDTTAARKDFATKLE
jgi:hypothetical protein